MVHQVSTFLVISALGSYSDWLGCFETFALIVNLGVVDGASPCIKCIVFFLGQHLALNAHVSWISVCSHCLSSKIFYRLTFSNRTSAVCYFFVFWRQRWEDLITRIALQSRCILNGWLTLRAMPTLLSVNLSLLLLRLIKFCSDCLSNYRIGHSVLREVLKFGLVPHDANFETSKRVVGSWTRPKRILFIVLVTILSSDSKSQHKAFLDWNVSQYFVTYVHCGAFFPCIMLGFKSVFSRVNVVSGWPSLK